jgi:hypothetical protein
MTNLTTKHLMAIEVIVHGGTDQAAADAAQVSRVTIYRWRHDPTFMAVLNRRTVKFQEELGRRSRRIYDVALKTVTRAIEEGDARLAFSFIKHSEKAVLLPPSLFTEDSILGSKAVEVAEIQTIENVTNPSGKALARSVLMMEAEDQLGGMTLDALERQKKIIAMTAEEAQAFLDAEQEEFNEAELNGELEDEGDIYFDADEFLGGRGIGQAQTADPQSAEDPA